MEAIDVDGIKVLFPYKPYDLQIDYMKSIIKCLQEKSNGLLESPTGTGKTVCILCSTLGWLDNQRLTTFKELTDKSIGDQIPEVSKTINGWETTKSLPQILYSSRTHQQLSQACNELKRTSYNTYKAVVIGSRDQLCLNEEVNKLETISAKNQSCRFKVSKNLCQYHKNYEQKVDRMIDSSASQVFDIEDLVKMGKTHTCCPYYASRHIKSKASIVFTPYNYILDPQIRASNALELKNSVVIFDEGHNIEKMCEESVSSELRSDTFAVCIKHINSILESLKQLNDGSYDGTDFKELGKLDIESVAKLKLFVSDLEISIDSMIKNARSQKTTHPTKEIYDIIERTGLDVTNCHSILAVIDDISSLLINSENMNTSQSQVVSLSLTSLKSFVEKLNPILLTSKESYESHKKDFIEKFKIFSEKGTELENQKNSFWLKTNSSDSWILHIWCLSPSVGAKALLDLGIHCMIITSGTLAPIHSFESEMEVNFAVKLQNSHIISESQLSIINISHSKDNIVLTSKYDNRDNLAYYKALGTTLTDIFKVIPKGVLVFFSSYTALNKSAQIWKQSNIWQKLNDVKQLFLEPRNKQAFNECIINYKLKIDKTDSNGAAFFGVCRGKLSEGIDLPNDYCRCVIMTGLPFPSVADPRVILKKQYLNEAKTKLSADGWYTLQMKRALNQSIGRVIRHKDDFGVIILLDSRFATLSDGLSKWVEKFIYKNRSKNCLDESLAKIHNFFSSNQKIIKSFDSFHTKTVFNDKLKEKPFTQFKSFGNVLKKSSINGFIKEETIFNELKSNEKLINNSLKPKSIFDSFDSPLNKTQKNLEMNTNYCENNTIIEFIDLDPSPNKKIKSICDSTLNDSKLETQDKKLQPIIKCLNKSITDSNSSKKVQWNENRNIVHKLDPIVVELDEDMPSLPSTSNANNINNCSEVKPIECEPKKVVKECDQQLVKVWRKNGAELKNIFRGTDKFRLLCETVRNYQKFKNIVILSKQFNSLFNEVEKRDQYIKDLSVIVSTTDRQSLLNRCNVKHSVNEFRDNEFKVINKEMKLIEKSHLCLICGLQPANCAHRAICCGFVACLLCFKSYRKTNSSKCFICEKSFKISDLKSLKFESFI